MNTGLVLGYRGSALAAVLLLPFRAVERARGWRRSALLLHYGLIVLIIWAVLWRQSQLARLPDVDDPFGATVSDDEHGQIFDDRNAFILYRQAAGRFREMNDAEGDPLNKADRTWSRADGALRAWIAANDQPIA